jgi:hypothetical protein
MQKANLPGVRVDSVKIGTTVSIQDKGVDYSAKLYQQFVNAVLEEDSSKLDKVAVIRLCGPYTGGSPPFGIYCYQPG